MPLPSVDALVTAIAATARRLLNALDDLRVHDRRRRLRISADPLAFRPMHGSEDNVPDAAEAKAAEMVVDRLPRREVAGQIPPRAAGAHEREECVKDCA